MDKFSPNQLITAKNLISLAEIFYLDHVIKEQSIKIRQKYNLKLGDAIIAATAICNNLVLVTRNTKDFAKIDGLKMYNPFELLEK